MCLMRRWKWANGERRTCSMKVRYDRVHRNRRNSPDNSESSSHIISAKFEFGFAKQSATDCSRLREAPPISIHIYDVLVFSFLSFSPSSDAVMLRDSVRMEIHLNVFCVSFATSFSVWNKINRRQRAASARIFWNITPTDRESMWIVRFAYALALHHHFSPFHCNKTCYIVYCFSVCGRPTACRTCSQRVRDATQSVTPNSFLVSRRSFRNEKLSDAGPLFVVASFQISHYRHIQTLHGSLAMDRMR